MNEFDPNQLQLDYCFEKGYLKIQLKCITNNFGISKSEELDSISIPLNDIAREIEKRIK